VGRGEPGRAGVELGGGLELRPVQGSRDRAAVNTEPARRPGLGWRERPQGAAADRDKQAVKGSTIPRPVSVEEEGREE
jgi:hypothetical protein